MAHKKDIDEETELEVYEPALKFHERMAKRRENFRTRKERVDDTVENAEHKKLNVSVQGAMRVSRRSILTPF